MNITDKVFLVELSFLEGLDNIYFTRRKETKMTGMKKVKVILDICIKRKKLKSESEVEKIVFAENLLSAGTTVASASHLIITKLSSCTILSLYDGFEAANLTQFYPKF